jgi:hypothetical protein
MIAQLTKITHAVHQPARLVQETTGFRFPYKSLINPFLLAAKRNAYAPDDTLFLGIDDCDQEPVLLQIGNSQGKGILITGETFSGKTTFLQIVAMSLSCSWSPSKVQFAVITQKDWEWHEWILSPHCIGVFSPSQPHAWNFITALELWLTHAIPSQTIFLLIDDLAALNVMENYPQDKLSNIFMMGPRNRLVPIASVFSGGLNCHVETLLSSGAAHLACTPGKKETIYHCQYLMKENSNWRLFSMFP